MILCIRNETKTSNGYNEQMKYIARNHNVSVIVNDWIKNIPWRKSWLTLSADLIVHAQSRAPSFKRPHLVFSRAIFCCYGGILFRMESNQSIKAFSSCVYEIGFDQVA